MAWIQYESRALSVPEMQNNAVIITTALRSEGWTDNAIAGLLGNVQVESSLNPLRWQNDDIGVWDAGFGLIQWTPASDFKSWCDARGLNYKSGNDQVFRINWELENGGYYYPTSAYPISMSQFKASTTDASYLASAYLYNRERPGDPGASETERRGNAETWYQYIVSGSWDPVDPEEPGGLFPNWNVQKVIKYGAIVASKRKKEGFIRGL